MTFFSQFASFVRTYKLCQPILFFYCYQFHHAAVGDRVLALEGIIDTKTIFSVSEYIFPLEMFTPPPQT